MASLPHSFHDYLEMTILEQNIRVCVILVGHHCTVLLLLLQFELYYIFNLSMIFPFQILIPIRYRKFRSRKQKFLSRIENLGIERERKKSRKEEMESVAICQSNVEVKQKILKVEQFCKKSHSDSIYFLNFESGAICPSNL